MHVTSVHLTNYILIMNNNNTDINNMNNVNNHSHNINDDDDIIRQYISALLLAFIVLSKTSRCTVYHGSLWFEDDRSTL